MNGSQGSADLRIKNGTQPSELALGARRDVRSQGLNKQNLRQAIRHYFRERVEQVKSDHATVYEVLIHENGKKYEITVLESGEKAPPED